MVKGWVDFYRRHEPIITSDIIHVRRPDGRDLDCMLHANASLEERGLAFIWNPTDQEISRIFTLPLYYTGIENFAEITVNTEFSEKGKTTVYTLDRGYNVSVPVSIPAKDYIWLLIKESPGLK